ncbi:hypothetical protein CKA32_000582 [Geitlerinema sp. FC II]|nr:hypothetical protein [Geitlerinema sp. CS-897]PPT08635.1 hypothetical protein CKA32_000582 [Geitlerinema sp. FC II]
MLMLQHGGSLRGAIVDPDETVADLGSRLRSSISILFSHLQDLSVLN